MGRGAQLVKENFVWKDPTSVWYQHEKIASADRKTFRHLAEAFYRDANRPAMPEV